MCERDAVVYFGYETVERFKTNREARALAVLAAWEQGDVLALVLIKALGGL